MWVHAPERVRTADGVSHGAVRTERLPLPSLERALEVAEQLGTRVCSLCGAEVGPRRRPRPAR